MKQKRFALLVALGAVAIGILAAALTGALAARDVPFAFGALGVLGALWLAFTTLRVRDE